jgi:hypothetical protein
VLDARPVRQGLDLTEEPPRPAGGDAGRPQGARLLASRDGDGEAVGLVRRLLSAPVTAASRPPAPNASETAMSS